MISDGALAIDSHHQTVRMSVVSNRGVSRHGRVKALSNFLKESGKTLSEIKAAPNWITSPKKIFEIVTGMVRREVGTAVLEDGMAIFLHQMWGGGVELRVLTGLYYKTKFAVTQNASSGARTDSELKMMAEDCERVVRWYGQRKVSLLVIGEEFSRSRDEDLIFGLRVLHDRLSLSGAKGIEVVCGVRLSGRANSELWLKAQFREGKKLLKTKEGTYIDKPGFWLSSCPKVAKVAGVAPLCPPSHRCIIDELRMFVPYSAIGLSPGKQTLEVVASVGERGSDPFLTRSDAHNFYIPAEIGNTVDEIPSPQICGIWQQDFSHGDVIRCATVAECDDGFVLKCDVEIVDREGASVVVSFVPHMEDGWEGFRNVDSTAELKITAHAPVARFLNVEKFVSKSDLIDGQVKYWQILVSEESRRAIVGSIVR